MDWERVLNMEYTPPIVPGPHECCIDEEFLNLPLDFEDSSVPVPTERRQSCYYESTIMLRTIISDKNTMKNSQLQQLYNNLNDTRNFSLLGDNKDEETNNKDEQERRQQSKSSSAANDSGARVQPQDFTSPIESSIHTPIPKENAQNTPGGTCNGDHTKDDDGYDPNEGNIVIEGLENFSFIDMPEEEIELRVHFNKFIE